MYSYHQYNEQLEDNLYREDDSEGSEPDSELEFHLYSQLHYSSNAGEVSEPEDKEKEVNESIQDDQNKSDASGLEQPSEKTSSTNKTEILQIEKKEKRTKATKKEEKPRSQRPSSVLEEVIVIDSSPDVITLSEEDSGDEKEGVCLLKGQRLPKLCTSTPAQEARKRMSDAADPVTVTSSDSDSESQCVLTSSSSSDSEDLENWMILGHDQQEGDQSISLNLHGVAESDTDIEEQGGHWLISDKDKKANISNKDKSVRAVVQRLTSRYYTDKNVQCKNCNRTGHLSKNCPEPTKCSPCFLCATVGHKTWECPYKHCDNCGLPGHLFSSCIERVFWYKQCHRCGMIGHFFDACPEIWRQYHITIKIGPPVKHQGKDLGRTPPYCYNCSSKGHFGHQCSNQRMFNGTFPSTPFINHYDTMYDIKCRQERIKHRFPNLKNNGLMTHVPQSPSTSGPPTKKQKTSLDKSHHRHTPRQSFKSDLPASKHTFFSDTSDPASKRNKRNNHKVVSQEKPWKPKRPVPHSRDSAPNAVVVIDEEDDFPRGGGQGEEVERKKKGKKMKKNGKSLCWTKAGKQGFFSECSKDKNKKLRKRKQAKKNAKKNIVDKTYPTDENLFIIKQRTHKRF